MSKVKVGLARRGNRRENIYGALDLVRDDVTPKIAEQVLLKPNFLSGKNAASTTHADAIRGALDFLMSTPNPPREVLIAEGGNEDYSGHAFEAYGYHALRKEYDVSIRLIDLNVETMWETVPVFLHDGTEYHVHMPKTVLDCPCTISVALPKTHDVCVVTQGLKNMIMGSIRKVDRVKMHGYMTHKERVCPDEARILNVNLIRLAKYLTPDIGLVDGTVGLQGNGPLGNDTVDLGVAGASADVFAVDAVMTKAMGFEPLEMGLLHYANELGIGVADLERIDVLETTIADVAIAFEPHETTDEQMQWHEPKAMDLILS